MKIWTIQIDPETGLLEYQMPIKEHPVKIERKEYFQLIGGRKLYKGSEFTKIFKYEAEAKYYYLRKLKELKLHHKKALKEVNHKISKYGVPNSKGVSFLVRLKPVGEDPILCTVNRASEIIGIKPAAVYNAIERKSLCRKKYRVEKVIA